jgi:hypothetical protein
MTRCTSHLLLACALTLAAACGWSAPYTDPKLLDVPWGKYSFIRQGWRGYLETLPARRYRDGLGVVWGQTPPNKSAADVATGLSWAGFRRVRLEIPWGSVKWDESGLIDSDANRTIQVLRALRAHDLRPLIVLNANHLQPCPVQWRSLSVERPAAAGERVLVVSGDLAGVGPSGATVMSLADGVRPGPLIAGYTDVRDGSRIEHAINLSKPLARAVKGGETMRVAVLRYPPLYPVGTAQFDATASGWLRYVELVADLVHKAYGGDFDVEVWNELTFGSAYLNVDNYDDSKPGRNAPDFLHPGGSVWELAQRTATLIKKEYPGVKVIWGFSNTTFFNVKIPELPPQIDGQSYHPYGTGKRCYADLIKGREDLLLDSYVPGGCVTQPEGYAHAWQQTESLLRFLAPAARAAQPRGPDGFQHFITEHGLIPAEMGIADRSAAEQAKQKFLLRAPLLWLNKGISAIYIYDVYEPDDTRWGVFRSDGTASAGMRALHNLTSQFAAADDAPIRPRQLSFEVEREGPRAGVLPGDPQGDRLPQQDVAAFLPFQLTATRFLIGAYVMTQDFPNALAPQPYQVTISGVDGRHVSVRYYAPGTDTLQPLTIAASSAQTLTLRLALTDVPNLIEVDEFEHGG